MSSNILKDIKELLIFYIKTNYEKYLKDNNIQCIPNSQVNFIIKKIYTEKKTHSKKFVKEALKEVHGNDYVGDTQVDLLLIDIYDDDMLMITKLEKQIIQYQKIKNE
tara:strand:- start:901 stop:1221 length:321 start_codon:yes stop_codon:yes gene_type:complete